MQTPILLIVITEYGLVVYTLIRRYSTAWLELGCKTRIDIHSNSRHEATPEDMISEVKL